MKLLIITICFLTGFINCIIGQSLDYEKTNFDSYTLTTSTIKSDTTLELFKFPKDCYGLTINGTCRISNVESLSRVILVDEESNEHLIYELYSEIADSLFDKFQNIGIETELFEGSISPKKIRIELINSSITIDNINTYDLGKTSNLNLNAFRKEQHQKNERKK